MAKKKSLTKDKVETKTSIIDSKTAEVIKEAVDKVEMDLGVQESIPKIKTDDFKAISEGFKELSDSQERVKQLNNSSIKGDELEKALKVELNKVKKLKEKILLKRNRISSWNGIIGE